MKVSNTGILVLKKPEQLKRLKKLKKFVAEHVTPKHFDMTYFRGDSTYDDGIMNVCTMENKTCGSNGCLMGWTPFPFKKELVNARILPKDKTKDINYHKAATFLFGLHERSDANKAMWNFLFSGDWGEGVPKRTQKARALKRLQAVIDSNGRITPQMIKEMDKKGVYTSGLYVPSEN